MKKKFLAAVAAAACAAVCAAGLVACNNHKHAFVETEAVTPTCTEGGYVQYQCECGETYRDNETERLGHDLDAFAAQTETCTEIGWNAYEVCKREGCGYTTYAEIAAHHTPVTDDAVPATCTDAGLTEGSHCDACGEVFEAQETVPATGHTVNGENMCSACGADLATAGVRYTLNEDGASYTVSGVETAVKQAEVVYVAHEYEGKPVTAIEKLGVLTAAKEIYIPEGVKTIGYQAFINCNKLRKLSLPSSLESLEADALQNMIRRDGLSTVKDGLCYIGNAENPYVVLLGAKEYTNNLCVPEAGTKIIHSDAFDPANYGMSGNNTNLIAVNLPDTVVEIGEEAFWNCISLSSVSLGSGLKTIRANAFYGCTSIGELVVPDSVERIETAFYGNKNLTKLTLPFLGETKDDTVNNFFGYIFGARTADAQKDYGSKYVLDLTVTSATKLAARALYGCNIEKLTLGAPLREIGNQAVLGCAKLAEIHFKGAALETIGSSAFNGCGKLQNVYFAGTQEQWSSVAVVSTGNTVLSSATVHCREE